MIGDGDDDDDVDIHVKPVSPAAALTFSGSFTSSVLGAIVFRAAPSRRSCLHDFLFLLLG